MKFRALGQSGLSVAPFAFGGNVFGWTADEKTSFALLDRFVERGFNLIDTADVYSKWVPGHRGGESETIIGKWLKQGGQRREQVVIASKVGMAMSETETGLSRARIRAAVDASLSRLGCEIIDLYQAHTDDAGTPLEETLSTFTELIKAGKVRAIGASNYSAARLAEAMAVSHEHGLARYDTLQPQYNLMEREGFEDGLLGVCQEHNIAVISYYSLASGFLSGKYRSQADLTKSPRGQAVKKYLSPKGQAVLAELDRIAQAQHTSPAAVALAWLMAQPSVAAPIASATSVQQLDELLAAAALDLDGEALAALARASATEAS